MIIWCYCHSIIALVRTYSVSTTSTHEHANTLSNSTDIATEVNNYCINNLTDLSVKLVNFLYAFS